MPVTKTTIVFWSTPFHSFNKIPQILLKITFNDMRILHEKANITGESAKKLFPIPKPKNCEYHNTPASAQNKTLFHKTPAETEKYSFPV